MAFRVVSIYFDNDKYIKDFNTLEAARDFRTSVLVSMDYDFSLWKVAPLILEIDEVKFKNGTNLQRIVK